MARGLILPFCAVVHDLAGRRVRLHSFANMVLRPMGTRLTLLRQKEWSVQDFSQSFDAHGLSVEAAEKNKGTATNASASLSQLGHRGRPASVAAGSLSLRYIPRTAIGALRSSQFQ